MGVLLLLGALILGAGRALPSGLGWTEEFLSVWAVVRWPVGVAIVALAVTLWVIFTGLLSLYFSFRSSSPYGSLVSIIALLVWSMLSSLALHLGIATACTLSGARRPRTRSTG